MPEEKTDATTWASQLFGLIRLFGRFSQRWPGLLMIHLGWALLLMLVAKLSPSDKEASIGIPSRILPPWSMTDVQLSHIYVPGAIFLTLGWGIFGGVARVILLPVAYLLRIICAIVLLLLSFVCWIIALPFIPLLRWIESRQLTAWKKTLDPEKVREVEEKHGRETLLNVGRDKIGWSVERVINFLPVRLIAAGRLTASVGRIGIAPLFGYTLDEDENASKALMQGFTSAENRLRSVLHGLETPNLFQFVQLPPTSGTITLAGSAEMIRHALLLDALLWGSYVSTSPPRICLNIQRNPDEKRKNSIGEHKLEAERREKYSLDPFLPIAVPDSAVIVNQQDPEDVFIAFGLCLLQVLGARKPWIANVWYLDRVVLSRSERDQIIMQLIREALLRADSIGEGMGVIPTARGLLVTMASDWVANQLEWSSNTTLPLERFHEILEKCVALESGRPQHYYRLGAVKCMLNEDKGARRCFARGQKLDKESVGHDRFWADAAAVIAIQTGLDRGNNHKLAVVAAQVARSLALGTDDLAKRVREHIMGSIFHQEIYLDASASSEGVTPEWLPPLAARLLLEVAGISLEELTKVSPFTQEKAVTDNTDKPTTASRE